MTPTQALNVALQNRTFVKVIAGIDNFDPAKVLPIVDAATAAGAHAVDIACEAELIRQVKARTSLTVFVSSTEPKELIAAAKMGADVLELGNFDAMYREGLMPTAEQILDWTREVKAAVGDSIPLCVTVCGRLPLADQVDLAQMVQAAGADIIQAEGTVGPMPVTDTASAIAAITSALANAAEIRRAIEMPLFVAGGITPENAAFAIAAGANGVGVGKAVSSKTEASERETVVREIVHALHAVRSTHRGLKA